MEDLIINKVAQSELESIDLGQFFPEKAIVSFDLKDFLFMELILKEKDFREKLKNTDWEAYRGQIVCIYNSADAIIPMWAYMLAVTYLGQVAEDVLVGDPSYAFQVSYLKNLMKINPADYQDKRVVIKGCGDKEVPAQAYAEITRILLPVAKSIMYGEPCSTVPVYKKRPQ
ncbi:MAG: DUF2480 family protein [Bacteroidota bacterium]|nr:DUF2480 family protein [Bacteroidota bacterium]